MSMEYDNPAHLPIIKAHRRIQTGDTTKNEKKRKRKTPEDSKDPSPNKKQRSEHKTKHSTTALDISSAPLDSTEHSSLHRQTYSLYLPLSPICQRHPLQGLCAEHLSPLILTYYPPFYGVILAYTNVALSADSARGPESKKEGPVLAQSIDEYAVSFVWVTADFLLFRPEEGNLMEGWINLQNEGNIGLVCWNFFNASIERRRLPKGWTWIPGGMGKARRSKKLKNGGSTAGSDRGDKEADEETQACGGNDVEGHFEDATGKKVEGLLRFTVKSMETSRSSDRESGFLNIEGTTLDEKQEEQLQEQEAIRLQGRGAKRLGRRNEPYHATTGVLSNGHVVDHMDVDGVGTSTHKATY